MDPKIETRSLVWELLNETTGEVLRTSHQTVEEFGLRFVHEGQEYLVRCRIQDYSQSAGYRGYRVTDCGPCGTVEMMNELARRGYVVLEREKYFRLLREATDGGK